MDYANFVDRLRLHQGKKQLYGSGFDFKEGKMVMSPTEDMKNLDKRLSIETGLPVSLADDPLASVVLGTGKMLSDFDLLKRVKWENTMTSGM